MSRVKLKIHADHSALAPGQRHVVMLYPFWGKSPEIPGEPDSGRFDAYASEGGELFELSALAEADIAVLAGEWVAGGGTSEAFAYCEQARQAGKKIIIFFNNDSSEDIPIEEAIIFRTSAYSSSHSPNVFGLPAWSEDFVNVYRDGILPVRSKQAKPIIGYCGYGEILPSYMPHRINNLISRIPFLRRFAIDQGNESAMGFRSKILNLLAQSKAVRTHFLLRKSFWNGAITEGKLDLNKSRQSRIEFANNMFDSDYTLCTRGAGNFSFRLYEVLCSGRIPVFINTDCLMPLDSWINWRDYCVWVEASEAEQVVERLLTFHAALSPEAFEKIQHSCRQFWLEYLSPMGFFSQLYRYVKRDVKAPQHTC